MLIEQILTKLLLSINSFALVGIVGRLCARGFLVFFALTAGGGVLGGIVSEAIRDRVLTGVLAHAIFSIQQPLVVYDGDYIL